MQKKSYGTLCKGAIFFGQPCIFNISLIVVKLKILLSYLIKLVCGIKPATEFCYFNKTN